MKFPTSLQMGVAHGAPPKRLPPYAALSMRAVEWWCLTTASGCQLSSCRTFRKSSRLLGLPPFTSPQLTGTFHAMTAHADVVPDVARPDAPRLPSVPPQSTLLPLGTRSKLHVGPTRRLESRLAW